MKPLSKRRLRSAVGLTAVAAIATIVVVLLRSSRLINDADNPTVARPASVDQPSSSDQTTATRDDAEQPPPRPGQSLTTVSLPSPVESPIERLRRFKEAGHDRFVEEEVHAALEEPLHLLLDLLRGRGDEDSRAAAAGIFTADFESTPLAPESERMIFDGAIYRAFEGAPSTTSRAVTPSAFADEITAIFGGVDTMPRAELKTLSVAAADSHAEPVLTEVLVRLGGESADTKRRLQWNGRWELTWSNPRAPRLRSLRVLEWSRATATRPPFVDVTESALGGSDTLTKQLEPSIDSFRDTLDAATGIDIYGHHGVSVGDLNGDGLDDIYVPEPSGLPNLLFVNNGDGSFEDLSKPSGADLLNGTFQALIVDLDNDGDRDLFLVTDTGAVVLKNDGTARFSITPVRLGQNDPLSTLTMAAAEDYDRDGWIDIAITSYVFWRGAGTSTDTRLPLPYHDAQNGAPNYLLRNRGDGTFEDVTERAGLAEDTRYSLAVAWGDADGDGWPDFYVANDFGSNNLYHNLGDGTFEDVATAAGAVDVGPGMSVDWADYDNDGDLDIYVGNMFSTAGQRVTGATDYKGADSVLKKLYRGHAKGNTLLRNRGNGTFEDVSVASRTTFGRWAWGSGFVDFNLDGHEDIYVTNGFVTGADQHDL